MNKAKYKWNIKSNCCKVMDLCMKLIDKIAKKKQFKIYLDLNKL